jgi:SAM-dependent methyltransferase
MRSAESYDVVASGAGSSIRTERRPLGLSATQSECKLRARRSGAECVTWMFVIMVREVSKSVIRRSFDQRFTTRWFVGNGIDIGAGNDPLSGVGGFFPLMRSVRPWDRADGDAMLMPDVDPESYDFVHSSHCLEHMVDPVVALANWINICKKGGHLVITVPDEDLYEQGVFPSTFNWDHKWTFTIGKQQSWCVKSINVIDLLAKFTHQIEILKIELLDSGFAYGRQREDQTLGAFAESAIEMVLRKKRAGFG